MAAILHIYTHTPASTESIKGKARVRLCVCVYSSSGFSKRRYAGVDAAAGPAVRAAINDENSDGIVNPCVGPIRWSDVVIQGILSFRFFFLWN